ncbi:hypothetical protein WA158_006388 [Blastocystis sp. Blastoise]
MSENTNDVEKVFAFSEQELLDPSFNPDEFVSKHRKFFELEVLHKDLDDFINKCQSDIMSIMNNDYESFISLAFRLKGLKESIDKVEIPLVQNRNKLEDLHSNLIEKQHLVDDLLKQYIEIKGRRELLEKFLKIDQFLLLEEQLLSTIKSNSIDIYTKSIYIERICRVDRVVKQYIHSTEDVYMFLEKCKDRCLAIYTDIYTILTSLYMEISLTKECSNTLLNLLRGYMYINKEQEAIDIFSNTYIIPICEKYINKTNLDKGIRNSCKGLNDIYNNIYNYIQTNCLGVLGASKEIFFINKDNEKIYIFNFLLEGIWQYIEKYICDNIDIIFVCGVTSVYHDNYLNSIKFMEQLSQYCVSPAIFYAHSSTKHFLSQWDLSVYTKLVTSDIYMHILPAINKYKDIYINMDINIDQEQSKTTTDMIVPSLPEVLPFKLTLSKFIWYYFLQPFTPSIYIYTQPLSSLYISISIYNKYIEVLQDIYKAYSSATPNSINCLFYMLNDILLFHKYIPTTPFCPPYSLSEPAKPSFTSIFTSLFTTTSNFVKDLSTYIYTYITNKCIGSISSMKTITSIYRMTQKPAPTEASSYVSRVFSPLDVSVASLNIFANIDLSVKANCFAYVYEHVLMSFKENAEELKKTVYLNILYISISIYFFSIYIIRMEDMLSKHRRRVTNMNGNANNDRDDITDEQKMKLQLKLDIKAICDYKTQYSIQQIPAVYDELMQLYNTL